MTQDGTTPAVRVAQAQLEKARLDLQHTVMRAPEEGWITHFDLTPGTGVTPGNPLFAIVVGNSFWVDAARSRSSTSVSQRAFSARG